MKYLNILLTLCLASTSMLPLAHTQAKQPKEAPPQSFVIQIGTGVDNLHSSFMALKVATMLAKRKQKVTLFLNLEGVRLADKRQPLDLKWGMKSDELKDIYANFVSAGGQVLVCPHCARATGLTKKHLRKGATIGTNESVAQALISADKIMDY